MDSFEIQQACLRLAGFGLQACLVELQVELRDARAHQGGEVRQRGRVRLKGCLGAEFGLRDQGFLEQLQPFALPLEDRPLDVMLSGEDEATALMTATGEDLVRLQSVAAQLRDLGVEPAGVTISALRAFPCRGDTTQVHRIEIPYGRFERRIGLPLADPYAGLELAGKELADGVLTLVFRKKESA